MIACLPESWSIMHFPKLKQCDRRTPSKDRSPAGTGVRSKDVLRATKRPIDPSDNGGDIRDMYNVGTLS